MKVEIKKGKAVELNSLDKDPKKCTYPCIKELCGETCGAWKRAETKRKVYDVYSVMVDGREVIVDEGNPRDQDAFNEVFFEGSIHNAELINETTVRLIC